MADEDWKKAAAASEKDGRLVSKADQLFLTATDFSPGFTAVGDTGERLFEMRTYTTSTGRLPALHSRFRDHTLGFFRKHGITSLGYYQPVAGQPAAGETLLYFLAHKDAAAAQKSWDAFRADPIWVAVKKASEDAAGGSLTVPDGVKSIFLKPTDFAPLATKPDFARCLERVEAWFHQSVLDRPPVRFYKHNAQFDAGEPLDRTRWASQEERWMNVEYQIESFERTLVNKTFHAETFPVFSPNLGPSVYSAFYGGRLEFAEVTSWYEPVLTDLADLTVLQHDPFQNRYFKNLEEQTRAALARCDQRYWVGYTDLHPSLDCVAAWSGIDALCLEMAMEPASLVPLMDLSVRDFHRIFDHFDVMLKAAAQPSGTWINSPCVGKLHIPSCDVSTMISTEHFKQFSLPQLRLELQGMWPHRERHPLLPILVLGRQIRLLAAPFDFRDPAQREIPEIRVRLAPRPHMPARAVVAQRMRS
jgi:hypothetical protein